eukprot:jgi/Bigna1/79107/fgenesh1_pg.59_\
MAMPINQMMSSEVRCAHLPALRLYASPSPFHQVLTAGICTSCGLFGAIVSPFLIKLMRITSPSQSALRGISAGSSAHGLGAAIFAGSDPRAFVYGVVTFGMVGAWSAMLLSESSPFKEAMPEWPCCDACAGQAAWKQVALQISLSLQLQCPVA